MTPELPGDNPRLTLALEVLIEVVHTYIWVCGGGGGRSYFTPPGPHLPGGWTSRCEIHWGFNILPICDHKPNVLPTAPPHTCKYIHIQTYSTGQISPKTNHVASTINHHGLWGFYR